MHIMYVTFKIMVGVITMTISPRDFMSKFIKHLQVYMYLRSVINYINRINDNLKDNSK